MKIDIVVLGYNRPSHTRKVLQSLADNNVKNLFFYLDFGDNVEVKKNQEMLLSFLEEFPSLRINLIKRGNNLGLAQSVRTALTERFEAGADGVILLEDDCVVLPGGMNFFYEGLKSLQSNKRVRSLCGYKPSNCRFVLDPEGDLLLLTRFLTWGWATWADRWEQYEPDLMKLVQISKMLKISIEDFSDDLGTICNNTHYLNGNVDIWSVNWILLHYLTSTFAVYPAESVIKNIGLDGSGVNCLATQAFSDKFRNNGFISYNWSNLKYFPENEEMIRAFMKQHAKMIYPLLDNQYVPRG